MSPACVPTPGSCIEISWTFFQCPSIFTSRPLEYHLFINAEVYLSRRQLMSRKCTKRSCWSHIISVKRCESVNGYLGSHVRAYARTHGRTCRFTYWFTGLYRYGWTDGCMCVCVHVHACTEADHLLRGAMDFLSQQTLFFHLQNKTRGRWIFFLSKLFFVHLQNKTRFPPFWIPAMRTNLFLHHLLNCWTNFFWKRPPNTTVFRQFHPDCWTLSIGGLLLFAHHGPGSV